MKIWRQGDVVFQSIGEVKLKPKMDTLNNKVEFHSETGKMHTLQLQEGDSAYQLATQDQESYLMLSGQRTVTHPEHAPITLPAGTYRAFRIRDFNRMQGD